MHRERVGFGTIDEGVFGRPAADAIAGQMDRLRPSRALPMVSGTPNRATDETQKIRKSLRRGGGSPWIPRSTDSPAQQSEILSLAA